MPLTRNKGVSLKIRISDLLSGYTSDADGDGRALIGIGVAGHGTLTTNDTYIFYSPSDDSNDSFTYTIRDLHSYRPGDTVRTAMNSINITVGNSSGIAQGVTISGGTATVNLAGIPGYTYLLQRSTNLIDWTAISTNTAPTNGVYQVIDNFQDIGFVPSSAYYRMLSQ
jgi:hypothetical protein